MNILIVSYKFPRGDNLKLLSSKFLKLSPMAVVFRSTIKQNKKAPFFKKPINLISSKTDGQFLPK